MSAKFKKTHLNIANNFKCLVTSGRTWAAPSAAPPVSLCASFSGTWAAGWGVSGARSWPDTSRAPTAAPRRRRTTEWNTAPRPPLCPARTTQRPLCPEQSRPRPVRTFSRVLSRLQHAVGSPLLFQKTGRPRKRDFRFQEAPSVCCTLIYIAAWWLGGGITFIHRDTKDASCDSCVKYFWLFKIKLKIDICSLGNAADWIKHTFKK